MKTKRQGISKRVRFEVLKRDGFERAPSAFSDVQIVERIVALSEPPWDPDDGVPMPDFPEVH